MTIERAHASIGFSLQRLRTQASELAGQQFPGDHPGPRKWLSVINAIIDVADGHLKNIEGKAEDSESIKYATDLCNLAYFCFRFLRNVGIDDLPYAVVPPLQRWFSKLKIENTILFRAEQIVNYELTPLGIDKITRFSKQQQKKLNQALTPLISWPLLVVTVPSKAFSILPHFAIVAHEIGHAIILKSEAVKKVLEKDDTQKDVLESAILEMDYLTKNHAVDNQEQEKFFQNVAKEAGFDDPLEDTVLDTYKSYLSDWHDELLADAVAYYLTGPAIFFALSDFFQLLGLSYGVSKSHPSYDFRRSVLFRRLTKEEEKVSYASVFRHHTEQDLTEAFNSPLLAQTPDKATIITDLMATDEHSLTEAVVIAALPELITPLIDEIYSTVKKYLENNAKSEMYTPKQFDEDLTNYIAPMIYSIPPIEAGKQLPDKEPAKFASILNVGWVVLLTKLGEMKLNTSAQGEEATRLQQLHNMLLKAVELSEARREWMEHS